MQMKKKCPLCNKMILLEEEITEEYVTTEFYCPNCAGELLLFSRPYKPYLRLEARNTILLKCPVCGKKTPHDISKYRTNGDTILFRDFHICCSHCETIMYVDGLSSNGINNSFKGIMFDEKIDAFAEFTDVYYVIAVKDLFLQRKMGRISSIEEASKSLKKLLVLPKHDYQLACVKRHDDYSLVSECVRTYLVDDLESVKEYLPEGFEVVYTSGNLLARKEIPGDLLSLMKLIVSMTEMIKDICGKAAITTAVVRDLDTVPSEIPSKWSQFFKQCQSTTGYSIIEPLYKEQVFLDLRNPTTFKAERHLWKKYSQELILKDMPLQFFSRAQASTVSNRALETS